MQTRSELFSEAARRDLISPALIRLSWARVGQEGSPTAEEKGRQSGEVDVDSINAGKTLIGHGRWLFLVHAQADACIAVTETRAQRATSSLDTIKLTDQLRVIHLEFNLLNVLLNLNYHQSCILKGSASSATVTQTLSFTTGAPPMTHFCL